MMTIERPALDGKFFYPPCFMIKKCKTDIFYLLFLLSQIMTCFFSLHHNVYNAIFIKGQHDINFLMKCEQPRNISLFTTSHQLKAYGEIPIHFSRVASTFLVNCRTVDSNRFSLYLSYLPMFCNTKYMFRIMPGRY